MNPNQVRKHFNNAADKTILFLFFPASKNYCAQVNSAHFIRIPVGKNKYIIIKCSIIDKQ